MLVLYNSLGRCICQKVFVPKNFWQRAKGLLGKKSIAEDEGYLFYDCNSVHMFAMRFSIDLVYLNKKFEVIKLVKRIRPWQMSICIKAKHVIEIRVGKIEEHKLSLGEKLFIREV